MKQYDLAIAWNWEFDADFVHGIERACHELHLTSYQVRPDNLRETLGELASGNIGFGALCDRASDADEAFLALAQHDNMHVINPPSLVAQAIDKSAMHLSLISHGLHVPESILLPPYNREREIELPPERLAGLGIPFVIKPANTTGGGTGVVLNGATADDIRLARTLHPDDKFLVQAFVHPMTIGRRRAWFRAYAVFQETILCWWDDHTHEYDEVTPGEEREAGLEGLREVVRRVQQLCKLDFFSSEVALTAQGHFVIVDYVNEVCDMRLKSKYHNGAPDRVVHRIQRLIAEEVAVICHAVKK